MCRILLLILILVNPFPLISHAVTESDVKAGFIRDGDAWILRNKKEKRITTTGNVFSTLKWSPDGKWLLYQEKASSEYTDNGQQLQIWAYHIETGEKRKIFYNGYSPSWSPDKNIVAFNAHGILNISDLKRFDNMAAGVDSYTWLPDGSGFLLSSAGVLRPDGWTSPALYIKKKNENDSGTNLFKDVKPFFTVPKEIGVNQHKIDAVHASYFSFSPSSKWISFIVSPTASWSMDSNMLCILTNDGKNFEVLDEVVFEVGKPKWAPSSDIIAFISGGGRIVFGFKNKDVKVKEMPASGTYTPSNYADLDFDWVTNQSIVTSRVQEKEWSNDFSKH
ncbi:MAG TPA: hypothetical protein VEY51_16690, partial [Chondromyces sp.]|nr:hypothetical protein [Chondromyces sp.]